MVKYLVMRLGGEGLENFLLLLKCFRKFKIVTPIYLLHICLLHLAFDLIKMKFIIFRSYRFRPSQWF